MEDQNKFKSNLNEIRKGNLKDGEKYQSEEIKTIKNLYGSRQKVIDLFNDYTKIKSDAMYKRNKEQDLKY